MTQLVDNHEPDVLTVEEAAKILRIGRHSAYALARRWLATKGAEGLPVIRLGRSLRVPKAALKELLSCELRSSASGPNVVPFNRSRSAGTL